MSRYVIACGGSGGHLSPGIAIAEELSSRGEECFLLVSEKSIDNVMLKKYGKYECVALRVRPLLKGVQNFFKCVKSQLGAFFKCIWLIRSKKVDCVIGMGGFTSVPIVMAAFFTGKKIVLHESNRVIGRSVRLLARFSNVIFLPDEVEFEDDSLRKKTLHTSMPLRREMHRISKKKARENLNLGSDCSLVTIFGGSQGAEALNSWALANLQQLNDNNIAVCCVRGPKCGGEEIVTGRSVDGRTITNLFLSFCDNMQSLLSATDLLVCRAGAGTIAEATNFSLPMILIPYPNSACAHQEANAAYAEKGGVAITVRQNSLKVLTKIILECFSKNLKNFRLKSMPIYGKPAVETVVDYAQRLVKNV
ncbi:MAG: UDP-N-acetylglucosamine--N-acetylmuramyl-(pentapeptide) pyrophosphoryl-undecaprenol N-acetylglucosamine transferase [Puniceicoccales bacterium]|jgi:UDP-N-acetylglucosamine--N-acetylmuramyl-(pentapeptide) pyrophosphoryl-undecaprenol N-acetylglucosamine transferase|nr:UDP-N-acetylglucosamine--N-acetylmuramyl-(pentapeptide) pyrophosphoryl-undecaprenol N-acetylglucosamine transferase [Puniceicoccales bacterium]